MSQEQLFIDKVKNLENQILLFLYENSYLSEDKNVFPLLLDFASSVTPLQYLVKQVMEVDKVKFNFKEEDEEYCPFQYTLELDSQLYIIMKNFRLLIQKITPLQSLVVQSQVSTIFQDFLGSIHQKSKEQRKQVDQVWYSIYEVYERLNEWTNLDHAIYCFPELVGFVDAKERELITSNKK
jgi:hypothetical protein